MTKYLNNIPTNFPNHQDLILKMFLANVILAILIKGRSKFLTHRNTVFKLLLKAYKKTKKTIAYYKVALKLFLR